MDVRSCNSPSMCIWACVRLYVRTYICIVERGQTGKPFNTCVRVCCCVHSRKLDTCNHVKISLNKFHFSWLSAFLPDIVFLLIFLCETFVSTSMFAAWRWMCNCERAWKSEHVFLRTYILYKVHVYDNKCSSTLKYVGALREYIVFAIVYHVHRFVQSRKNSMSTHRNTFTQTGGKRERNNSQKRQRGWAFGM